MSTLNINGTPIPVSDRGLYNINVVHQASGGMKPDRPGYFLATKQSKEMVQKLKAAGIPATELRAGIGTFVAKPLVIAYAMWLSVDFALKVIQAYDASINKVDDGELDRIRAELRAEYAAHGIEREPVAIQQPIPAPYYVEDSTLRRDLDKLTKEVALMKLGYAELYNAAVHTPVVKAPLGKRLG